jgi:hypothetical protein
MKPPNAEIQKPVEPEPDADEWWARGASIHYSDAHHAAKAELKKVIAELQKLEKRKLFLRKALETLGALCDSGGATVEKSTEAANFLDRFTLAEETRNILQALHPNWATPHEIKAEMEKLGHKLKHKNPQAAIQTVLTRMVDAGEAMESWTQEDPQIGISSKRIYRFRPPHVMDEAEAKAYEDLGLAARLRKILETFSPQSFSVEHITRKLADTGFDLKGLVSPRVEIERALEGLALSGEITDYDGNYGWSKPKRRAAKKKPPAK